MDVNIIDVIVGIVILFFAIRSFIKGFIQEILQLVAWVASAYATMYIYDMFIPFYEPYIESLSILRWVSIITAFIISIIIFHLISIILGRILSAIALTPINQSLGFLFGIVKGTLLITVCYMGLAGIVQDRMPKVILDSESEPYIRNFSEGLAKTFPDRLKTTVINTLQNVHKTALQNPQIKETLKDNTQKVKTMMQSDTKQ